MNPRGGDHDEPGDDGLGRPAQVGAAARGCAGRRPLDSMAELAPGRGPGGDGQGRCGHDECRRGDELRSRRQPEQRADTDGDTRSEIAVGQTQRHDEGGGDEERDPGLGAVEVRVLDRQNAERRQRGTDETDSGIPEASTEHVDEGDGGGVDQRRQQPADEVGVVAGVEGVDACWSALGVGAVGAQLDADGVGGGDDGSGGEGPVGQERRGRLGGEQRRRAVHPGAAVGVGVELGADAVEVAGEPGPGDVVGDDAPVPLVGVLVGALVPVQVPHPQRERHEQDRSEQDAARDRRVSSEEPHDLHRRWIGSSDGFVQEDRGRVSFLPFSEPVSPGLSLCQRTGEKRLDPSGCYLSGRRASRSAWRQVRAHRRLRAPDGVPRPTGQR